MQMWPNFEAGFLNWMIQSWYNTTSSTAISPDLQTAKYLKKWLMRTVILKSLSLFAFAVSPSDTRSILSLRAQPGMEIAVTENANVHKMLKLKVFFSPVAISELHPCEFKPKMFFPKTSAKQSQTSDIWL